MLYGGAAVASVIACVYLCLRKGNAFAADVTPPVSLRRWAAAFFAVAFLGHVWWYLFFIFSGDIYSVSCLVVAVIDSVSLLITITGTLLAMLQDRKRPVWPALVIAMPFVALAGALMAYPSRLLEQMTVYYILLLYVLFTGYMVVMIRQYGRWLNDNYADLENKKVWLSQTVALVCMLLFILYVFSTNMVLIWLIHIIQLVLVGLLLWRVETLPQLPDLADQPLAAPATIDLAQIEQLLAEHCVGTQLYLQHDLTLQQLAQAVGTNRFYLSQYFSRQSITYNSYINNLRINHFISRYQEVSCSQQPFTVQQLANESGYRSYSTFSLAFKQRTGQSVTAWMRGR